MEIVVNMYIRPLFIVVLIWVFVFAMAMSLARCETQRKDSLTNVTQSCKEIVKVVYLSKNML